MSMDFDARVAAAKTADAEAWAALIAAKHKLEVASFNVGDDLDALYAATEVFQGAIRNLLDAQYHLEVEQAMAAEFARRIAAGLPYSHDDQARTEAAMVGQDGPRLGESTEAAMIASNNAAFKRSQARRTEQAIEAALDNHNARVVAKPALTGREEAEAGNYKRFAADNAEMTPRKPVPQYRNSQGQIVYDIDPDAPPAPKEGR